MEIFSYFKPEGLVAEIIVWVLLIIFAGWVLFLGRYWYQLARSRRKMKNSADVRVLTNAFRQRLLQQSQAPSAPVPSLVVRPGEKTPDPSSTALPPHLSIPTQREADDAFREFCRINRLKEEEPLAIHIRAIFKAGWNDNHLEVEALVNNTTSELLRKNSAFRSVLSVFIIIGLLGTLFGLASTLAQLARDLNQPATSAPATQSGGQSATSPESGQSSSDDIKKKLDAMLGRMQGAFAPSIVGVTFSILGVLLFALFQYRASSRLGNDVARYTFVEWVPALMPTPAQTLQEKLQISQEQIQRSLDSALKIAAMSDEVKNGASGLNQAIKASTSTLTKLTEASTNLSNFSDNFVQAVNALKPFQQELHTLYQQMSTESRAFQESVQKNITGAETFQKNIEVQLAEQNRQLPIILKAFQAYETAYVTSRQNIDADLKGLLDKLDSLLTVANQTFENLGQRNKEITSGVVTALGDPLRQELTQGLRDVKGALDARLTIVSQELKNLFTPLDNTSTRLTGTLENLDKRTETLLKEVQQEFAKQNQANDTQLQGLLTLSNGLKDVLEKLTSSSQSFADYGQKFDTGVNTLSQNVGALSGNVDVLSQKLGHRSNGRGGGDSDTPVEVQLLRKMLLELQNLSRQQSCNFVQDSHTPQIRRTLDQMLSMLQNQAKRGASPKSKGKRYSDSHAADSHDVEEEPRLPVVYQSTPDQADEPVSADQPKRGRIRRFFGRVRHPFRRRRE